MGDEDEGMGIITEAEARARGLLPRRNCWTCLHANDTATKCNALRGSGDVSLQNRIDEWVNETHPEAWEPCPTSASNCPGYVERLEATVGRPAASAVVQAGGAGSVSGGHVQSLASIDPSHFPVGTRFRLTGAGTVEAMPDPEPWESWVAKTETAGTVQLATRLFDRAGDAFKAGDDELALLLREAAVAVNGGRQ